MHTNTLRPGIDKPIDKFEFIELSDLGCDDDEPKWNVICQTVVSKSHAAGDFVITLPMLHQAVSNFKLRSTGKVPIYFEHYGSLPTEKIDPEKGAPAQGHIIDMAVREDGKLWGLCKFYEPAKGYVKSGKYPFFSPGLFTDSLDRSTGKRVGMKITEVSLVGNPHLYDMPEVCASNDERQEPPSLTAKSVPATSGVKMTLEEALAEIKKLNDQLGVKDLEVKAANAKATEAESNGKVALANKERELADLKAEHDKLVGVMYDDKVEEAYKTYQKSHNLTEAHKPVMKSLLLTNPAGFALYYPPKAAPVGKAPPENPSVPAYVLRDLTTGGGQRPPARTTQRRAGGPSEVAQIKARLLAENPKLSEDDAIVRAYEEAKSGKKEAVA